MIDKNDKDFKQKYEQALVRVGLGMYIIDQLFKQHGTPHANTQILEDKDSCNRAWAAILANGLDMSVDKVVTDATATYLKFPPSFLNTTSIQQEIQKLVHQMSRTGALPRFY